MGNKKEERKEFLDEDVYRPVPKEGRNSWIHFLMIFIGMWASLAAIGGGVDIGMKITPWKACLGLFLGYMICLVVGLLIGEVGRKERLSTYPLLSRPFSPVGKIVPVFFVFLIAGIFIGVQADAVARVIMSVIGWEITPGFISNRAIFSTVLCAIMMYSAYKGIGHIKIVSWVAMPLFITALIVFLVIGVMHYPGGLSAILTQETHEVGFSAALFLGVSLYAGFTACLSDVSRFITTQKGLIISLVIGYAISAFIPIWGVLVGRIHGIVYWEIFATCGVALGVFAAISLFFAQWTTNDNNCFTSGLALSTIFRTFHDKWKKFPLLTRKYATLVPAIVGVILAFVGSGAVAPLLMFVGALGSWLPPAGGVMIAHFYVVEGKKEKIEAKGLAGLISWIVISSLVQFGIMPWAAIMGILGAFVLYLILYYGVEVPIWGKKIIGEKVKEEKEELV